MIKKYSHSFVGNHKKYKILSYFCWVTVFLFAFLSEGLAFRYICDGRFGDRVDSTDWKLYFQNGGRSAVHYGTTSTRPWFSPSVKYIGNPSLSLDIPKANSNNANASERTQYSITGNASDPNSIRYDNKIYYCGFVVRLGTGSNFNSIRDRFLLYQSWQGGGVSSPGNNPPLSIYLKPWQGDSTQKMQVRVKNETHVKNSSGSRITFDNDSNSNWHLKNDSSWYKFIIEFKPSYDLNVYDGRLIIRKNGVAIVNETSIECGYQPNSSQGVAGSLTSTVDIYRAKQKRRHRVHFANWIHTDNAAQVDPDLYDHR